MRSSLALAAGLLVLAAVAGLGVGAFLAREPASTGAPGTSGTSGTDGGPVDATPTARPSVGVLTAAVDNPTAAPNERVTISGALGGDGAAVQGVALRAQRQEDGEWVDFPAGSSTGANGTYTLPVELGRPGDNVLRVVAPDAQATSDPVTVRVG